MTLARANWMRLTMILEELTTWMNIAHDIATWRYPPLTLFVTYVSADTPTQRTTLMRPGTETQIPNAFLCIEVTLICLLQDHIRHSLPTFRINIARYSRDLSVLIKDRPKSPSFDGLFHRLDHKSSVLTSMYIAVGCLALAAILMARHAVLRGDSTRLSGQQLHTIMEEVCH
jgi:hypothetical protein